MKNCLATHDSWHSGGWSSWNLGRLCYVTSIIPKSQRCRTKVAIQVATSRQFMGTSCLRWENMCSNAWLITFARVTSLIWELATLLHPSFKTFWTQEPTWMNMVPGWTLMLVDYYLLDRWLPTPKTCERFSVELLSYKQFSNGSVCELICSWRLAAAIKYVELGWTHSQVPNNQIK